MMVPSRRRSLRLEDGRLAPIESATAAACGFCSYHGQSEILRRIWLFPHGKSELLCGIWLFPHGKSELLCGIWLFLHRKRELLCGIWFFLHGKRELLQGIWFFPHRKSELLCGILFSLTSALSRRLDALLGSVLVQDLSDFELNLTIILAGANGKDLIDDRQHVMKRTNRPKRRRIRRTHDA